MKLEAGRNKLQTLEERTAEIERIQEEEERRMGAAQKELAEMKDRLIKQGQELTTHRQKEADLVAEISGAQGQNKCAARPPPARPPSRPASPARFDLSAL